MRIGKQTPFPSFRCQAKVQGLKGDFGGAFTHPRCRRFATVNGQWCYQHSPEAIKKRKLKALGWLPMEDMPKAGTFLVLLESPDTLMGTDIGIMLVTPNIKFVNGFFYYDRPKPIVWKHLPKGLNE